MARMLEGVRPGLVIVDGEEAITDLAVTVSGTKTPIQRCLSHLEGQTRWMARYLDRLDTAVADEAQTRLHDLLTNAYSSGDLHTAVAAYNTLIDTADSLGAAAAVTHLRNAAPTRSPSPPTQQRGGSSSVTRHAPSSPPASSSGSCAR